MNADATPLQSVVMVGGPKCGDRPNMPSIPGHGLPHYVKIQDPRTGFAVAYKLSDEKDRKGRPIYLFQPYRPAAQS